MKMEKPVSPTDNISCISEKIDSVAEFKVTIPLKSKDVQYGSLDKDTQYLIPATSKEKSRNDFQCLSALSLELLLFLFLSGYIIQMSCLSKLMMDKGCIYYFNFSTDICANASYYDDEKKQLEILANNYSLYLNLLSFVGAFAAIFIAPWSDKYGRKPPMILALFGITLSDVGFALCAVESDLNLLHFMLAKLPSEIFGGIICVMTIVFSLASEMSSEKTRTRKYATVEMALGLAFSIGGFIGGTLERYYGYLSVFLIALAMHFVSLIITTFCVPETVGINISTTWKEKIKNFFKFENLIEGWKVSVRRRENNGRGIILLLFFSTCFIVLTYESFGSIGYIYAHDLYNWDPMKYNSVNTIFSISQMGILIISIPVLFKIYKVTDFFLGIIGSVSMMGRYIILAFAHYGIYVYYLGNAVGVVTGLCNLAVRSGISKIVDKDELGRVFAFLATCESIVPIVGTLALTKVFNATIKIHPSITYLTTGCVLMLPVGTFTWAYLQSRKRRKAELQLPVQNN